MTTCLKQFAGGDAETYRQALNGSIYGLAAVVTITEKEKTKIIVIVSCERIVKQTGGGRHCDHLS